MLMKTLAPASKTIDMTYPRRDVSGCPRVRGQIHSTRKIGIAMLTTRVIDREPDGPHPVHVEPSAVPSERPEVHPARVEERLHREPFLDDPVRRAEEEDARPSGLPPDGGLAHDEDAGTVQPDQEERGDRIQPLQRRRG